MRDAVTIWHNPRCSTSRRVLGMIRAAGVEPRIVDVTRTPPDRDRMARLIAEAGLAPCAALRRKDPLFAALDLGKAADAACLDAAAAHPTLLERPFVETPRGVRLCRPVERLWEVMDEPAA